MPILPNGSIFASACRASASAPLLPCSSACPNLGPSRVNKWRLSRGLPPSSRARRRTTTTAANVPPAGSGGSRHIGGGRDRMRKSLYAAALACGLQMEPSIGRLVRPPGSRRQTSQARSCRLRPKAPHLRKYRSCPTNTMDRKKNRNRPALMVAQRSASNALGSRGELPKG